VECLFAALASLAATLVAIGEAAPPPADDLALELAWEAPAGCPDLAGERAEIRRRVGASERPTSAQPVAARGEIRADASGGYVLSLRTEVGGIAGERALAGQDCHQLAEAAALVLALLINPMASAQPAPPAPPPVAPPPPSPSPPAPARQRSGLGLGIDADLAGGVLPGPAGGLAARLFYQRGLIMAVVEIGGFLPKQKPAPVLPGATASFYRLESALELCAATRPGRRLGGGVCFGGAMVRLYGESAGVSSPGASAAYWFEALLEAAGHVAITSALRLRMAAALHGLGSRPDFAVLGLGSVYRPAMLNWRGALGLDVLF